MRAVFRTVAKNDSTEKLVNLKAELYISIFDLLKCLIRLGGNGRVRFVLLVLQTLIRIYLTSTTRDCLGIDPIKYLPETLSRKYTP